MPDPYFDGQLHFSEVSSLGDKKTYKRFFVSADKAFNTSTLHYLKRIKVEIVCDMNFEKFPFDVQKCTFLLESLKEQRSIRYIT